MLPSVNYIIFGVLLFCSSFCLFILFEKPNMEGLFVFSMVDPSFLLIFIHLFPWRILSISLNKF
jgi:hypothetical protein